MAVEQEGEITFRVRDLRVLTHDLGRSRFELVMQQTHEINGLYDLPGHRHSTGIRAFSRVSAEPNKLWI